jgi:hypothetical protein
MSNIFYNCGFENIERSGRLDLWVLCSRGSARKQHEITGCVQLTEHKRQLVRTTVTSDCGGRLIPEEV